jgi:hypothetical protein
MTSTECPLSEQRVITCTKGGFTVESRAKTEFVAGFDEVAKITIWKHDDVTTDLVCFEIELLNGEPYVVHEDMPGFEMLIEKLVDLDGFDRGWRDKVILPPFAANTLVAYERASLPRG